LSPSSTLLVPVSTPREVAVGADVIRLVETVEKFGGMVGAAVMVALVGAGVGSDELELRAVGVGSVGLGVAQKLQS